MATLKHALALLSLSVSLALLPAPQPVAAQAPKVTSKIERVTLYRGQAQVTRAIPVEGDAGGLEIVVGNLPEQVVPGSLFAEGDDAVEIRAVRFRTRAVGEEPREEVRKLDEQIRDVQRQLEGEIICMCGSSGCVRASLSNCPMRPVCHGHVPQTARIRQLVDEGKTHDEILAAFVREYGANVLAVPEDRGFNRLAWMFPYVLAAAGLITIIVNARRWSSKPAVATGSSSVTSDPALEARLDDELRDLD